MRKAAIVVATVVVVLSVLVVGVVRLAASLDVHKTGSNQTGSSHGAPDTVTTDVPEEPNLPDHKPQDVQDGLAQLSPCDFVDVAMLQQHRFPSQDAGDAEGSECVVLTPEPFTKITVTLGGEFGESARYVMRPITPYGFKAYVGEGPTQPPAPRICSAGIPVTFTTGIVIDVHRAASSSAVFDPCKLVEDLAIRGVELVKNAAPTLLFAEDEPDVNAFGACVHMSNPAGCVPYEKTDVPDDPRDMLKAAHSNANVACAAALDIVRSIYGRSMQPVVFGQGCIFVSERHEVEFSIMMSDQYVADEYGRDPENPDITDPSRVEWTVAGRPAVMLDASNSGGSRLERNYFIAVGDSRTDPGLINTDVSVRPPRGRSETIPVDENMLAPGLRVTEKLVRKYFP